MITVESILQYIYMIIFLGLNTCDRYTTIYGKRNSDFMS